MKSDTVSTVSPSISHEVMGPDAMIFVFWMLRFKPTFSLSYFTFIKRLFSSSSLSAIRVSSAYLRLLIFLPAILIPDLYPGIFCQNTHLEALWWHVLYLNFWAIFSLLLCGMRDGLTSFIYMQTVQLSKYHLLNKLCFLHSTFLHHWMKINWL